jgi:hypothetical protein
MNGNTTRHEHTHHAGTGFVQHDSHTMHINDTCQNIPINFEHYANPMVHPVTGCTIMSCKKLMHNPATAEIWQTTFGKDFGGMAQGCNKAGQKGTNNVFVMLHDEIRCALVAKFVFTYANPVIDYRP